MHFSDTRSKAAPRLPRAVWRARSGSQTSSTRIYRRARAATAPRRLGAPGMPLNHVSRHLKQHVRAVDRRARPRGSRATTVDEARPRRRRNASPRALGGPETYTARSTSRRTTTTQGPPVVGFARATVRRRTGGRATRKTPRARKTSRASTTARKRENRIFPRTPRLVPCIGPSGLQPSVGRRLGIVRYWGGLPAP